MAQQKSFEDQNRWVANWSVISLLLVNR